MGVLTRPMVVRQEGTEESEACLRSVSVGESIELVVLTNAERESPELLRLSTSSTLIVRVGGWVKECVESREPWR